MVPITSRKPHEQDDAGRTVDAMPTKELFIEMLTRDIALIPSIIDLVDNCADGARRIRGEGQYEGLCARLEISPEEFRVSDNCGGIDLDVARNYAFRFGRVQGAPQVKHSVGEFGVGMKRAIFKLGKYFRVESKTSSSRFVVEEDVRKWAKKPKWEYEFAELEEDVTFEASEQGTTIEVTHLHQAVSEEFALDRFITELKKELKSKLQYPIAKGLIITLNGLPIDAEVLHLLESKHLAPGYKQLSLREGGGKPVKVKLYCGLAVSDDRKADRAAAGWNIFCNGRLILAGDKTPATGWGEDVDKVSLPSFHGQYNSLRGYAYFDCDDPGKLPWNTTKTGLNTDSPIYRAVRLEMMKMALPVKSFLDKVKDEKATGEADEGPLQNLISEATPTDIHSVRTMSVFEVAVPKRLSSTSGPILQRIQYDKPKHMVEEVKKHLKARSWKEVGEKTFEYFYNAEVTE